MAVLEKRRFREEPAAVGKTGVALFEHEYDEMPPETRVEVLIEKAIKMLQIFYAGLVRAGLPNKSERLIAFGSSRQLGVRKRQGSWPMMCKLLPKWIWRCTIAGCLSRFMIGKPANHRARRLSQTRNELQVSVYMLWANLGLKLPLDGVTSRLVYLGGEQAAELRFDLDEERAVETYRIIEDSVQLAQRWEKAILRTDVCA